MSSSINPQMLKWARKRSGLSVEDLAERIDKTPHEVSRWEDGKGSPTYACLEDLAYRHFKVPLAVFFFPEPPATEDPVRKFRRLPDYELARLSTDTLHTIRLAQAFQDSLGELTSGPTDKHILKEIEPKHLSTLQLAKSARDYLGISVDAQFRFVSSESAFKAWRHVLEEAGVYTFKDSLKDRYISGFCLLHSRYPVIMVNNSNSFTRQLFTLIHELGHLLFGVYGLTDVDEQYIEYMDRDDKQLEIRCNKFASHFLVPDESFARGVRMFKSKGVSAVSELAKKYSVSREVILRRLLDHGLISATDYTTLSTEWNNEYLRTGNRSGGNYYLTQLAYLGEGFTRLVFENYQAGRVTKSEAAAHLNVKARNLDKLGKYLGW